MESKLFIFAVLVSITQCSHVSSSRNIFGLLDEQAATFYSLEANQAATLSAAYGAHIPIFDVIYKWAAELIWNQPETGSDDASALITEAANNAKIVTADILSSIAIVNGLSDSVIEAAQNTSNPYVEDLYILISNALSLARCGNYPETREEIEAIQDALLQDLAILRQAVFDLIRSCVSADDSETLAVIESFQVEVGTKNQLVAIGIINSIKLYAFAVTNGYKSVDLISEIGVIRTQVLIDVTGEIGATYALLETIQVASSLSQTENIGALAVILATKNAAFYKLKVATDAIFTLITNFIYEILVGFEKYDVNDAIPIRIAQAIAVTKFKDAYSLILASIQFLDPDTSAAAAIALERLFTIVDNGIRGYITGIRIAISSNSSTSIMAAQIDALNTAGISRAENAVNEVFDVIHNNVTWDEESEAAFAAVEDYEAAAVTAYPLATYDGILSLAKTAAGGELCEDALAEVAVDQESAVYAAYRFVLAIADGSVIALLANSCAK